MFADPQSLTVNTVATSLPRISNGSSENRYSDLDGDLTLTIKQNKTARRYRREVRVSDSKLFANPLTGLSSNEGVSVYLVIDEPHDGFTNDEVKHLIDALKSWLDAAAQDRLLGGEF